MPVYQLPDNDLVFPHPSLANPDGLLAVGGDLSPERLILAYSNGIFPWFSEGEPLLWWSPDPRAVLFPEKFKRHKSLRLLVQSNRFEVTFDKDFRNVIRECSKVERKGQEGTWITKNMIEAYVKLHEMGIAHSVETWEKGKLAGGLYGVMLGKVFFGESMFHKKSNASKVAFWYLIEKLIAMDVKVIDVQQDTQHLRSLGAELIPRSEFLNMLKMYV
jgi:leucyl/phenylalanyl-tRNA--protein transferase